MPAAIQYDIDLIRAEAGSPAKVLYRIWETLISTNRETWHLAERVLVDSWAFDSTMGNGINDLISNENYDIIANGLASLKFLQRTRLTELAAEIERVFRGYDIAVTSGDSIAQLTSLSEDERATLESGLSEAEKPFLEAIWLEGIIIVAASEYMERNLTVLRNRKAKQGDSPLRKGQTN